MFWMRNKEINFPIGTRIWRPVTYNGTQNHDGFVGLKNACSRAKTHVILHITVDDANFCEGPRMCIARVNSHASTT